MVRVKDALDAVGGLVANLVSAVRGASMLCILSAVLVLGGALAASHRHRVYEAVVLKTLGATRRRLLAAYALEYLALGAATAVFGVAAGSVAAWFVVADVMNLRLRMVTGTGARGRRGRPALDRGFRPDRNPDRAGPKARTGAAKPILKCALSGQLTGIHPA